MTRQVSVPLLAALACVAALSMAGAAQRLRPADVAALPSKPADARVAYGPASEQFGDLRLPTGAGPFPVVVVIHGGCWVSRFATLQSTAAMADDLRDAGVATWNIEYRRLDQPGGGWPGTFTDVAAAVDHLRVLAVEHPLDLERVVFTGHSAGAHLALWAAARSKLPADSPLHRPDPLRPRAVVPIGGPGDLADFSTYDRSICGAPVISQLMGGGPDEVPERYAHGSPIRLLPLGVPQVLVVGDSDGVMPEQSRNAYTAAARRAGDRAMTVIVPNAGHFEVIAPISPAWLAVRSALLSAAGQFPLRLEPDPPIACSSCEAWNAPRTPFRVFGNTFYVGVAGLSAVLIASADGHILLDGGLPQSAEIIDANIRRLGLQTSDIRLIVNSHAHYDHSGGIAAIARATDASVAASPAGARALELGGPVPDDPQYALRGVFPAVPSVRIVEDGETLQVGDLAITAHLTPGHTPGSTTWTWQSCQGSRCLSIVYADSLNAVSAPDFRFTAQPGLVEAFRRSIATVEGLPCDILLAVHPDFGGLTGKRKQQAAGEPEAFVDPSACRAYAAAARLGLERRIASER